MSLKKDNLKNVKKTGQCGDTNDQVVYGRSTRTRIFKARESLLTELFKDGNARSLYNVFPGIFCFTMVYSALKDYLREGRFYFGTRLIRSAFAQLDVAVVIWLCMFASSLIVYFFFALWVHGRRRIEWKGKWDKLFGLVYGLYVLVSPHLVAILAVRSNLGSATCLAVMLEMTRLLMKSHAFVRSNSPKFMEHKQGALPAVSHYLYFLFAPTLIYSDSYPRTNRIHWGRVVTSFSEVIAIIFMWSVIVESTYLDYLKDYGKKNYTFLEIITFIVECNFVGFVVFILLFYLCHSYFNGTAELTRFSDRLFYLDWWTAENWDEYLRKWSYFVHEWLHIYIYRDFHEILFPGRKLLAKVFILLLSGYFHDLILCVASRAFLPLITVEFLCFVWIRKLVSNKFMLGLLGMQISCAITLFMMEYYARMNCPMQNASIIEYLMPRFLHCKLQAVSNL